MAPIIPGPYPALDYGTKYNPTGSQPGLNDTNYGTPLPQPCPPPSNLSATAWKNRSKVPSRKVTIHCPAPRCDSLKEGSMTTSERKWVYWQLKTEIRRVYVVKQKKIQLRFLQEVIIKRFYNLQSYRWRQKSAGVTYNGLRRRFDEG